MRASVPSAIITVWANATRAAAGTILTPEMHDVISSLRERSEVYILPPEKAARFMINEEVWLC